MPFDAESRKKLSRAEIAAQTGAAGVNGNGKQQNEAYEPYVPRAQRSKKSSMVAGMTVNLILGTNITPLGDIKYG